MTRHARLLLPTVLALAAPLALQADTTGRISGTALTTDGKPVAGTTVVLKRLDVNWEKELKVDAKGSYFQIGLVPKEYEVTVSAPGYVTIKERVRVGLGETTIKNFTLLTPKEAVSAAPGGGATALVPPPEAESIKSENEATEAYNQAAGFYTSRDFAQALAPAEKAYTGFKTSLETTKDEAVKADLADKLEKASRLLGMVYINAGKAQQAKPLLEKHLEKNPKDGVVVNALLKAAKEAKDKDSEAKYQKLMDEIEGPKPEVAYNEAVTAFNAGKMKDARAALEKAMTIDSKFPESYYLLGMVEFSENKLQAAKAAFRKYLEIAPTGKKAGEVKEFLKELR